MDAQTAARFGGERTPDCRPVSHCVIIIIIIIIG